MPKKTGHCNNYISQNAHFQEKISNFPWAKCRYVGLNFVELLQKSGWNKKKYRKTGVFPLAGGEKAGGSAPFSANPSNSNFPKTFRGGQWTFVRICGIINLYEKKMGEYPLSRIEHIERNPNI